MYGVQTSNRICGWYKKERRIVKVNNQEVEGGSNQYGNTITWADWTLKGMQTEVDGPVWGLGLKARTE